MKSSRDANTLFNKLIACNMVSFIYAVRSAALLFTFLRWQLQMKILYYNYVFINLLNQATNQLRNYYVKYIKCKYIR